MKSNETGPNPSNASPKISVGADKARQGVTGHNVRYVLLFGILGAVLAFIALAFGDWPG